MKAATVILLSLITLSSLASCASKNVVVLLPGAGGQTGGILVSNKGGSQLLTEPNQATTIRSQAASPAKPFTLSEEEVRAKFGNALDALPSPPIHFTLYFKSDSTELTEESRKLLDEIVAAAVARKSSDVSVVGHTDRVGTREHNFRLGLERAGLVKRVLISHGIAADSIDVTSHGKDNPLVKTEDNVAEPRNRRVEVVVR